MVSVTKPAAWNSAACVSSKYDSELPSSTTRPMCVMRVTVPYVPGMRTKPSTVRCMVAPVGLVRLSVLSSRKASSGSVLDMATLSVAAAVCTVLRPSRVSMTASRTCDSLA